MRPFGDADAPPSVRAKQGPAAPVSPRTSPSTSSIGSALRVKTPPTGGKPRRSGTAEVLRATGVAGAVPV